MKPHLNPKPVHPNDASEEKRWTHVHPMLSAYTYKNLEEPKTLTEAHMRMVMHRNAVEDIEIQIKIAETNHYMFLSELNDFDESKSDEYSKMASKCSKHYNKIVVLLNSMLMHKRRAAAYWYWLQCHEFESNDDFSHDSKDQLLQQGYAE